MVVKTVAKLKKKLKIKKYLKWFISVLISCLDFLTQQQKWLGQKDMQFWLDNKWLGQEDMQFGKV